nr:hypothetical protein [Marisediminicola senii]
MRATHLPRVLTVHSPAAHPPTVRRGLTATQLNDGLWRVTGTSGAVVGYVEGLDAGATAGGQRFRAKRFLARQKRFTIDGEFWSMDDALECLRSL